MPIYVSAGTTYELHPDGLYPAVCVDVIDMGLVETKFGKKAQVRLVFQTPLDREDGDPFLLAVTDTASLNEKANLRHHLESWRGKAFTEAELERFDVENVLGKQCQIQVMHNQGSRGGTFANITNILPAAKGQQPLVARNYVREIERAPDEHVYGEEPETEEEAPF